MLFEIRKSHIKDNSSKHPWDKRNKIEVHGIPRHKWKILLKRLEFWLGMIYLKITGVTEIQYTWLKDLIQLRIFLIVV